MKNYEKVEEKTEIYLGDKIVSWRDKWEEFDDNKNRWNRKSKVYCHIYRQKSKWKPLNLGECNNGDSFTAVNQAINQAKEYINICNKHGW